MKKNIFVLIVILITLACFSANAAPIPDKKPKNLTNFDLNNSSNVEIVINNLDTIKVEFFICEGR